MDKLLKKFSIIVAEDDEDDRLPVADCFDENEYKENVEFVINGVI